MSCWTKPRHHREGASTLLQARCEPDRAGVRLNVTCQVPDTLGILSNTRHPLERKTGGGFRLGQHGDGARARDRPVSPHFSQGLPKPARSRRSFRIAGLGRKTVCLDRRSGRAIETRGFALRKLEPTAGCEACGLGAPGARPGRPFCDNSGPAIANQLAGIGGRADRRAPSMIIYSKPSETSVGFQSRFTGIIETVNIGNCRRLGRENAVAGVAKPAGRPHIRYVPRKVEPMRGPGRLPRRRERCSATGARG